MSCKQSVHYKPQFVSFVRKIEARAAAAFTGNCPWSRGQFRFIIDPTASGFAYAWRQEVLRVGESQLFDPFSLYCLHQVQKDLNFPSISPTRGLSVWGNPQTIKPFHFRALSPPCPPFLFQSVLQKCSPILQFMNQLQIHNLCQFLLY